MQLDHKLQYNIPFNPVTSDSQNEVGVFRKVSEPVGNEDHRLSGSHIAEPFEQLKLACRIDS